MRAARITAHGAPLEVMDIAAPVASVDSVVVDVMAAMVPPAMAQIRDAELPYVQPAVPFTPGLDCIGKVAEAHGGSGLSEDDIVYCDTLLHRGNATDCDNACFAGNFGVGAEAAPRLAIWRDGCLADKVVLPSDCVTSLRSADKTDPLLLSRLGWVGTVFGAFRRAELRPDHSLVITGATGALGVSAAALALAMGVRRVVAVGRRAEALERIRNLSARRIRTVNSAELGDGLHQALIAATAGGGDVMVDCVATTDDPTTTLAGIRSLRRFGMAVLLGNVSARLNLGYDEFLDKEITVRGSNWFERAAIAEIDGLIDSGLLDMAAFSVRAFPIEQVNDAIDTAINSRDGFEHVALDMSLRADQEA